jgi:hypothetical protein
VALQQDIVQQENIQRALQPKHLQQEIYGRLAQKEEVRNQTPYLQEAHNKFELLSETNEHLARPCTAELA